MVAPTPGELVNQRIDVLFDCEFGEGRHKKKGTLWCSGTVLEASTEETKVKYRGKDKRIGTGWVLVRYDAVDGGEVEEDWKLVKPSEYGVRRQKAGCWCLAQTGRDKVGASEIDGLSDLEEEDDDNADDCSGGDESSSDESSD